MPYDGEFAHYKSLKRIVESKKVKDILQRQTILKTSPSRVELPKINKSDIKASQWEPDIVIAIDGSKQEVQIKNGFPCAEVGYVTVASVIMDLEKVKELDAKRPINPVEFRKTERADSIDSAFPGSNIIIDNEDSAKSSLRKTLYEVIQDISMSSEGESLLQTYESLLDLKPTDVREPRCPYDDCQAPTKTYKPNKGTHTCPCSLKRKLYSTDALRIHEGMIADSSNAAMYAEIMQVLERLWLIHILRTLEKKEWLSILKRTAIVVDGPLAVFGHPSWLYSSINKELVRLNDKCKKYTDGQDMLIIGIDKGGAFADHLLQLDLNNDGTPGKFPKQSCMLLTDEYIKKNIIYSVSEKFYGDETYFGRKFYYKTQSGALIVCSLPFLYSDDDNLSTADPVQYPRLHDALNLLDHLVSSRYPNALTPIVSAHAEAAIPLNLGLRVLEKMAKELMQQS